MATVFEAADQTIKPSRNELVERARALVPAIVARTDEADRIRDTPAQTIAEFQEYGLLRMFQPRRWGGLEADPRDLFAVQNVIAAACPSTAWVYGVLCVQSLVLALFHEEAQADVWGKDNRALVSSAFPPVGKAIADGDGYRISGRWTFASGCTHAQWSLLGARLPPVGDAAPQARLFLVPRGDYEILDVWHTFGMRGTGSNDILVKDAFVPAHRMFQLDPGIQNVPLAERAMPPLYRLPWLYLFTSVISNLAIGTARGALDGFLRVTRDRVSPFTGKVAREDPVVQQTAARLLVEIDSTEAMYDRHIECLFGHVEADVPISMPEALLLRGQQTSALRRLAALVDELMLLQGSRAIELASPVTRAWLDLSAARAHIGNDPTLSYTTLGAMLIAGK